MNPDKKLFIEKLTGFLYGAVELGYDYDNAWKLLTNSPQGLGLLAGDYDYLVHFKGRVTAKKADSEIGNTLEKNYTMKTTVRSMESFAKFIEYAHDKFDISYDIIWNNISPNEFMLTCGSVLGNYDDKLIKTYILQ